ITPYDFKEEQRFSNLFKAVSVLVTGYLLGKIDPLVTQLFTVDFFAKPNQAFRFLLFVFAILVGAIVAYYYRSYLAFEGALTFAPHQFKDDNKLSVAWQTTLQMPNGQAGLEIGVLTNPWNGHPVNAIVLSTKKSLANGDTFFVSK